MVSLRQKGERTMKTAKTAEELAALANRMHSTASRAGIVMLSWLPSDVIEAVRKNRGVDISEETARKILLMSESEISERLWHQAYSIFTEELLESGKENGNG